MNPALTQIKEILSYGSAQLVSKAEIQQLMRLLLEAVKQLREERMKDAKLMQQTIEKIREEMEGEQVGFKKSAASEHEKGMTFMHKEVKKMLAALEERMEAKIPSATDLSGVEARIKELEIKPEPKTLDMDEMRLHALMGLSVADIEGLSARLTQLERLARGGGGRLLGGVLNIGARIETPPETPNSSLTVFTLFKTPKYIAADGSVYFENNGYTVSGRQYTLSFAPRGFVRGIY